MYGYCYKFKIYFNSCTVNFNSFINCLLSKRSNFLFLLHSTLLVLKRDLLYNPENIALYKVAAGGQLDSRDLFKLESNNRHIRALYLHPSFEFFSPGKAANDIGLVEVMIPFEFGMNTLIYPACILTIEIKEFRNDRDFNLFTTSHLFPYLSLIQNVHLTHDVLCKSQNNQFCAFSNKTNICVNEVGNGLYFYIEPTHYLVGIALSSGNDDEAVKAGTFCSADFKIIFMRVASYMDFISRIVGYERCERFIDD